MSPGTVIILVIVVIQWFACGFLSEDLHRRKGHEGGFWIGFLLGLVGLIYSVGLPDTRAQKVIRNAQGETLVFRTEESPAEAEKTTASDPADPPAKSE